MQLNILAWFSYNTIQSSKCNFYSLCDCAYKTPIKIGDRLFTQCKCLNGKRYLAFKIASLVNTSGQKGSDQIEKYILASGPVIQEYKRVKTDAADDYADADSDSDSDSDAEI